MTPLDAVRALVGKVLRLPADRIPEHTPLEALGLNSVDLIDIVTGLEATYEVQFDIEALVPLTCSSLAGQLQSLRGAAV